MVLESDRTATASRFTTVADDNVISFEQEVSQVHSPPVAQIEGQIWFKYISPLSTIIQQVLRGTTAIWSIIELEERKMKMSSMAQPNLGSRINNEVREVQIEELINDGIRSFPVLV